MDLAQPEMTAYAPQRQIAVPPEARAGSPDVSRPARLPAARSGRDSAGVPGGYRQSANCALGRITPISRSVGRSLSGVP
jgi:hypothetical protein